MSVRIARSCAGALRAVTSAVRTFIGTRSRSSACCSRCSASSSGLNGPGGNGRAAWLASCDWNAVRPPSRNTRSASSAKSTASPSKAMRTSSGCESSIAVLA